MILDEICIVYFYVIDYYDDSAIFLSKKSPNLLTAFRANNVADFSLLRAFVKVGYSLLLI